MPCRDYYDDHPGDYYKDVTEPALKRQISFAESALCETLKTFEKALQTFQREFDDTIVADPLDWIDYGEAGITRKELSKWWDEHKRLDAAHREQERLKKVRAEALRKLTEEEQQALGIKIGV
jgi:arsenate reductase-like glutaredoxin family protein